MATKVSDVEKESEYGYVFGVSGPGTDLLQHFSIINEYSIFLIKFLIPKLL